MFFDVNNTLAPAAPTLPTSAGVAIVFGYLLDLAKRLQSLPQINYYTTKVNTWLRIFLSGVGTLGVSWTWSAAGQGHTLLITIPAWTALAIGIWHWAVQYGMQHGFEILLESRQAMKLPATVKAGDNQGRIGAAAAS